MTLYEFYDIEGTWKDYILASTMALATILWAYVLTVHFIGRQLSKSQIFIVTFLFLWFSLLTASSAHISQYTLFTLYLEAPAEYGVSEAAKRTYWGLVAMDIGIGVAIMACLRFMWEVRQSMSSRVAI